MGVMLGELGWGLDEDYPDLVKVERDDEEQRFPNDEEAARYVAMLPFCTDPKRYRPGQPLMMMLEHVDGSAKTQVTLERYLAHGYEEYRRTFSCVTREAAYNFLQCAAELEREESRQAILATRLGRLECALESILDDLVELLDNEDRDEEETTNFLTDLLGKLDGLGYKKVCRECGGEGVVDCSSCGGLGAWEYWGLSERCGKCRGSGAQACEHCG